jgi:NADPH:quinone reductase-like Zn-dependent oxidoreductase
MRAAVYRQYGPPEVVRIEDVEQPVPGNDEVLVRIVATTVCTLDWRLRKPDPPPVGWFFNGFGRPKKFHVLGFEFAGTVAATGNNVTDLAIGERVFGSSLRLGSHAEYACYPRNRVARMPSNATFAEAAAIPYGGFTALHFLRRAGIKAGQKVLIYGASGCVGSAAVQIAKSMGAHVTGVCSTANLELVKSIGADGVIDYTKDDFAAAGRVYDIVQDAVGKAGFRRCRRALKRGGVFIDVGPGASLVGGLWSRATGAGRVVGAVAQDGAEPLDFLVKLFERGEFKPVIEKRYPLGQIVAAHRHAESGRKRGNVVIEIATVGRSAPTDAS